MRDVAPSLLLPRLLEKVPAPSQSSLRCRIPIVSGNGVLLGLDRELLLTLSELVVLPLLVSPRHTETPRDQRDDLEAFSHMSAVKVAHEYFERPPYRVFAIRRLIDLLSLA